MNPHQPQRRTSSVWLIPDSALRPRPSRTAAPSLNRDEIPRHHSAPGTAPLGYPPAFRRGSRQRAASRADVVETEGLTKRFGEATVVSNLDLRVPRGTAFGYLGPNGAGKTTLIRMLLGLTRPTAGTMKLLGLPMPAGTARTRSPGSGRSSTSPASTTTSPDARTCGRSLPHASQRRTAGSTLRSSGSGSPTVPTTASPPTRWGCGSGSGSPPA